LHNCTIIRLCNYAVLFTPIKIKENMIDIYDRVERLKKDFLNPNTSDEKKYQILEYFKEYNDLFYGDIDIDSFFRQLMVLSSKWDKE